MQKLKFLTATVLAISLTVGGAALVPADSSAQMPSQQAQLTSVQRSLLLGGTQGGTGSTETSSLNASGQSFLTKTAQDSQYEFAAAQLALQKAQSNEVAQYAQRLLADHSTFNKQIMQLARSKEMMLPVTLDSQENAKLEHLKQLSGAAFDRQYVQEMAQDNASSTQEFQQAGSAASDSALKSFITQFLPVQQDHYKAAIALKDVRPSSAQPRTPSLSSTEQSFLTKTAQDSLYEFATAQLALQKAQGDEVAQYALRLMDDHATFNKQLMQLARQKGALLPVELDSENKAKLESLKQLSGTAFDQQYLQEMAQANASGVQEFQQASNTASDAALKSFISQFVPVQQEHYAAAAQLENGSTVSNALQQVGNRSETALLKGAQSEFLAKTAQDSLYEFATAQLAVQQAQSNEVAQYGLRLIRDHASFNEQLMQLARQKGVALPVELDRANKSKLARLQRLNGTAFDQQYLKEMAEANASGTQEFQQQEKASSDRELSSFISQFLPVQQDHYAMANALENGVASSSRMN